MKTRRSSVAQYRRFATCLQLLALAVGLAGCGDNSPVVPPPAAHKHQHHPPHGGTPVVLGDEAFHLELVLDNQTGIMDAYVLDDEMEEFVRISAETFNVNAKLPGHQAVLQFKAVANRATGETVGDTSLFETQANWLKSTTNFDAVLPSLTVKGDTFTNISFNFPKGNDTD
jgi:predicted small lipoprotein YifL